MADTTPVEVKELMKVVKQQIMLSIGLSFEEKDKLIRKLPSLDDKKLAQLKAVFDEENKRKEEMLGDFFAKHPELYTEFERFSREHVDSIYDEVESGEEVAEEALIKKLLATSF